MVESFSFEFDKDKIEKDDLDEDHLYRVLDFIFDKYGAKKTGQGEYYAEGHQGISLGVLITISSLPEIYNYLSKYDCEHNFSGIIEKDSYLDAVIPQ